MRHTIRNSRIAGVIATPSFGLPGLHGRNHYANRTYDELDGGSDGEGGGAEGGDGGGEPQAHEFKDENAFVRIPGMDKPIKVSDLKAAYSLQGQHQTALGVMGQIAAALKANAGNKPGQQAGKQGQQPGQGGQPSKSSQQSAIEALESADIIDGKTAAQLMRNLETGTLAPMAKALISLSKQVEQLQGHVGRHVGSEVEGQFGNEIGSVVKALKLPDVPNGIPGSDVVNEMIRDFYHSFDENSQKQLRGDTFAKEFKPRFDAARKFFRELEKAELTAAQTRAKQRIFAKPGAGSSTNGKAQKRLSNHDIAGVLFAGGGAEA